MKTVQLNDGIGALLLEHAPAAIAVFDNEMRYLGVSDRWLNDYQIATHDIVGKSHYEVFPEIDDHWRSIHRRVLSGESVSNSVEPFRRQDGSIDWVKWEMIPWNRTDGEIGGAILFSEVLKDPVQSREWLRALDAELNLLIQNTQHTSIYLLDAEGRISLWNEGAERMFGWTDEEIVGQPCALLFRDEDRECASPAALLAQTTQDAALGARAWRIRKDGSEFYGTSAIAQILDDHQSLLGFGMAFRDTTQESERLARIEAREALLSSVLETVPDAMLTIDEFGMIESFSAAAERLFGYDASEVVGCNVAMLMPDSDAEQHDDQLEQYRTTVDRHIIGKMRRVFGRRKDGTQFPHELYIGEAVGGGRRVFTGFVRDLTAREHAAAELQQVQAELIQISRVSAIGTMATALAHDLNQPLTAVTNYVQSASALMPSAQGEMLALVREALDAAGREAMRAGEIVRRLRDFIARGELDRTHERVDGIVSDACALAAVGSRARAVSCEINIPKAVPPVLIDRVQVQQVLINLIQNAIEAMESAGILRIDAERNGSMVKITVTDSGPGIPAGKEDRLFDPFISSKSGGMGLGLAISRTIVEAHGGKLWCTNAPGGGARFRFTLPVGEMPDE